jgi:hypothetical protein
MERSADDEQIIRDMCGEATPDDIRKVMRVTTAWAEALDKLGDANDVRTVFMACVNTIGTMGPAYCKIAAATLMHRAKEYDRGDA